mmetsp:Transcript_30517/g.86294  ORF Transcript_30517/g.86294 Transcript_30517/m.86294 type:complete len:219 (-) Transcript_30517:2209-2865(-)
MAACIGTAFQSHRQARLSNALTTHQWAPPRAAARPGRGPLSPAPPFLSYRTNHFRCCLAGQQNNYCYQLAGRALLLHEVLKRVPGGLLPSLGRPRLPHLVSAEFGGCFVPDLLQAVGLLGPLHHQSPPVQVGPRHRLNGALGLLLRDKLHKGKPSVASVKLLGKAQALELPHSPKQPGEVLPRGLEGHVAHHELGFALVLGGLGATLLALMPASLAGR